MSNVYEQDPPEAYEGMPDKTDPNWDEGKNYQELKDAGIYTL